MPNITRPLPDTHPEFTVLRWPGFTEYKVAHYRLARDGSGRIVRGTCIWSWVDTGVIALLAWAVHAWFEAQATGQAHASAIPILATLPRQVLILATGAILSWLLWSRLTQVLHESVLVFPTLGIQLETHRGHPLLPFPLSITRNFIPLSALEDVFIHEGFRRWNVRYYLAALRRRKLVATTTLNGDQISIAPPVPINASGSIIEVHVAFENILPYFPVLREVYCGVQEMLFLHSSCVVDKETGTETQTRTMVTEEVNGDARSP